MKFSRGEKVENALYASYLVLTEASVIVGGKQLFKRLGG